MSTVEIFVDETRGANYILVAAAVASGDLAQSRRVLRALKPANRDRVHMHSESKQSRDRILAEFLRKQPITTAVVFIGALRGRRERDVRTELLQTLAAKAIELKATRILIESCSQDREDHTAVVGVLAQAGIHDRIQVVIDTPRSHELLWAADILAWAVGPRAPAQTRGRRCHRGDRGLVDSAKTGRPRKTCGLPASLPRLFTATTPV
ncbi:hypothetical protein GORHZ_135_00030 [Gordonia rhizosphera NBRC 16068]|uniref:DUF3800 domain-containing protein n=1 Tax=Gordonia rhizosphera NBRC 16068 TaxID=1108045 RepID=K6WY18_9ACTN|nr:hypothetical protein GORHZ_135_00030 [Gordonia rhizosphera NBRC 16068]